MKRLILATALLAATAKVVALGTGIWPVNSLRTIYRDDFEGHEDLDELSLYNVIYIGQNAFYDLQNLKSITIQRILSATPEESIKECIFVESDYGCFNDSETGNPLLESFKMHNPCISNWNYTTAAPYYAYMNCTPPYSGYKSPILETVILPKWIHIIRECSFSHSEKLRTVTIPHVVADIMYGSFEECPNIETVICHSGYPPRISSETFNSDRSSLTLIVPDGFAKVYAADSEWGKFGKIIEDKSIKCSYSPEIIPQRYDGNKFAVNSDCMNDVRYSLTDENLHTIAITAANYYIKDFEHDGYPIFTSLFDKKHVTMCDLSQLGEVVQDKYNQDYRITSIGNHAFSGIKHSKPLTICSYIEHIGCGAFYIHQGLETVRVHRAEPPTMGDDRVFGDKSSLTLEVPVGAAAAYRAAEVWRDFGNIVENAELGNSSVVSIDADIPTGPDTYYTIDGRRLTERPAPGTIHIVRHADGTATLRR